MRGGRRVEGCKVEMRGGGLRVKELLLIKARRQSPKGESKNWMRVSCFEQSLPQSIIVRYGENG